MFRQQRASGLRLEHGNLRLRLLGCTDVIGQEPTRRAPRSIDVHGPQHRVVGAAEITHPDAVGDEANEVRPRTNGHVVESVNVNVGRGHEFTPFGGIGRDAFSQVGARNPGRGQSHRQELALQLRAGRNRLELDFESIADGAGGTRRCE